MTWTRTLATGSGRLDFRLEIAGCQHEWTTNPRITHASGADGRRVFPGLQYQGLELNERAILKDCWVDVSGITARIKPTTHAEETIDVFTRTPEPVAYLAEGSGIPGLEADTTTIHLDSAVTLDEGMYHLGSEAIEVIDTANHIVRAKWGTTAQRHYTKYGSTSAVSVPLYRYPPTLEGRRATLSVYGEGDDGAGDGTAVWRGIVARPPRLDSDGLGWTIQLDPVTKALEQNVAAAESLQYRIRGIYHSVNFPMRLSFTSLSISKSTANDTVSSDGLFVDVVGFYESQADFITAVNARLVDLLNLRTAQKGSQGEFITAVYDESTDNAYIPGPKSCPTILAYTEPNLAPLSDTRYLFASIHARSYLEGFCDSDVGSLQYSAGSRFSGWRAPVIIGQQVYFLSSSATQQPVVARFGNGEGNFITPLKDAPNAPFFTYPLTQARTALGTAGDPTSTGTSFPADRIYLDTVDGLEVDDVLLVKNGDKAVPITVTAIDTDDRWIAADIIPQAETVIWFDSATEIVPARIFAMDTELHGFVEKLVEQAPNANDGDTPYVIDSDISTAAFAIPFDLSDVPEYWRHRNYVFLKPTSIKEIIREELKPIGWMLRLTATGSVGCTRLPLATAASTATNLDETKGDILLPAKGQVGAWPRWEAQADGLVNTIQVSLGYRIGDDDFDPKFDFTVRNITSIAEHKSNGTKGDQAIAPKSTSAWAATLPGVDPSIAVSALLNSVLTPTSVATWVSGYLRVLSQDYATVTVSVPFRFFNLLIGDYVNVTCSLLPNGLGGRGVSNAKAVVVGRKWSFDPAANAMGTLTLYFPREVASGYAPSANITSQSNVSGNTWDLSASASDPLNILMSEDGDGNVAKHFAANDKVQIVKRNDGLTPTSVAGTVASTASNSIRVTFTGTWTPGSDDWVLQYQLDSGSATAHMRQFSFVADAIRSLANGSYARRYL